jgi:hypothetical protein
MSVTFLYLLVLESQQFNSRMSHDENIVLIVVRHRISGMEIGIGIKLENRNK